ncbi:spore_SleB, spore cortex-lytic enzyme [uncultured Caudovirales phage]|uniref:Spore_SleB, spore cortex-lytic enzyme n=1 Tax=uncultured Caudovirales phage TaxID=2100421 RepID=A0A6J5KRT4_9CAUD|nr:spore_SleB, spore cortex-lytic enzyme [uncultured Caudovirales phage]CAB4123915.1 spore_SleB, spore cortex-lytic enzyme [uncultured Caudovirales phage]CAB5219412.1 spore_SleB, spore cortex-lytic enzyme [uncultured Caudovirales phage]
MLQSALMCLAMNVYYEARGEDIAGQFAVAQVTMNRAKEQKTVCKTVLEPHQFSWTDTKLHKVYYRKGGYRHVFNRGDEPTDTKAWSQAVSVSKAILTKNNLRDITHGATFYHTKYVKPFWAKSKKYKVIARIGNHVFYREA